MEARGSPLLATKLARGYRPLAAALRAAGERADDGAAAVWWLRPATPTRDRVAARLDEEWLELEAPVDDSWAQSPCQDDPLWTLLARNARLPPGFKYVLPAGAALPVIRVEVPIEAWQDETLDALVGRLCELRVSTSERGERPAGLPHASQHSEPAEPTDLPRRCAEAGWTCIERPSGALEVELADRHACRLATLWQEDSRLRLGFAVLAHDSPPRASACWDAVGLLLLRASAALRLVRAAATEPDRARAARFEVLLPTPAATAIGHALAALSAASELFGREIEALAADPALSATYLSMQGGHRAARVCPF